MASPGNESKDLLEAQLRATLDVIPAYTWYADPSGALAFVNKRHADYLGLPKDHPLRFGIATGAAWDSHIPLLHPDDQEESRKVWSTCVRTGCAGEFTFRIRNAEGVHHWFLTRAEPLRASDGTLLYWIGVNLEIDELKQAEFFLSEGQRLAHMGSWAFNPTGFEYWSTELFRVYGLDPSRKPPTLEEYLDLVHPEDREFVMREIQKMLANKSAFEFTKRIVRPDGKIRRVHCVGIPTTSAGTAQRFVGTGLDVTEQEELAEEVRHSEAYLAEAQRLSQTGSWAWSPDHDIRYWSEECYRVLGFDPRNGLPRMEEFIQRIHPEDQPAFRESAKRAKHNKLDEEVDYRILHPGGAVRDIHSIGHPVFSSSGDLIEFTGTVIDITDRKRAEESLRSSEAYLAEAQRLSQTGSWAWSPDDDIRYWSEECYRVLSFDPQDGLPRFENFFQRIHPDDQPGFRELIETAIREKAEWEADYRIVHPDGPVRDIHVVGHPILGTSGDLIEFVGTVIDVTERKRAEEERRRSEIEFRQILDFAPWQVAVLGADGKAMYLNKAGLDYHGLTREGFQDYDPHRLIHPDDHDRILTGVGGAKLLSDQPFENEARLLRKDGKYRWFLFQFNPLRDGEGRVTRWYVTNTDIEDRKQTEERLQNENVALREEIDKASMFEELVGTSRALQAVLSRVSKVARSDSTVLITGETGTGKELVARAIHRRSNRASRAFVSVNCAAIPRDLIASELFGHEKGAFTGATQQRLGRFELASGGTIFLDEVGELPAETQIALLRVLQEHEFERVGGTRRIRADVRVIAATNRDLQAAISAGSFRSDLFYRLHVFPIEIPPLRERKEDIPLLIEYFIDRYARKAGKRITTVDKKTLRLLEAYYWPGNIRELQNVIERSVILCETETFSIDESWLPQQQNLSTEPKYQSELPRRLLAQEKEMIEAALKESRGRIFGPKGAAANLGIPRSTLESKIRSLRIDKNRFKT